MASLIIATVTQAAFTAASVAIRRVFSPGSDSADAARLDDLSVQSSALGTPIPVVFGNARVAGNVIWSTGLIERQADGGADQGGKGGGADASSSSASPQSGFAYFASFAVGLSARPVHEIGRIWADGKLIRDAGGEMDVPGAWRLYKGGEDQAPDPLIEADVGQADAPAFRGLAYVVFEELALAGFGNRLPNLTFELVTDEAPPGVGTVASEIAGRAGVFLEAEDGASAPVPGLVLQGDVRVRDALAPVLDLAPVHLTPREAGLVLRRESETPVLGTERGLLDARPSGDPPQGSVRSSRGNTLHRPMDVEVRYSDPVRDYQPGVQRAVRHRRRPGRRETRDVPLVLSADQAKTLAARRLQTLWRVGEQVVLVGAMELVSLEPGDRLVLTGDETEDRTDVLVESLTFGPGQVEVQGHIVAGQGAVPSATADAGRFPEQRVEPVGETQFAVMDLPLMEGQGETAGLFDLFAALTGEAGGWRGGRLFVSEDGGDSFTSVGASGVAAVMGRSVGALPTGPTCLWDERAYLDVVLTRFGQTLESRTAEAILNGANLALIGQELVQFRHAEPIDDTRIRLSGFLRGRRGTEDRINDHVPGERFVLIQRSNFVSAPVSHSQIGRPVHVKTASVNRSPESADAVSFTPLGRSLMPFSPAHIRAERDADGAITLRWVRRTRLPASWRDGVDVPLGEEAEAYAVDILAADGTVRRTFQTDRPALIYTAADQTADFGAPVDAASVRVQQLSAVVGRGLPATATI